MRICRKLFLTGCAGLFLACGASGQYADLPKVEDPGKAARIIVIRNQSVIGSANTYRVVLDGREFFNIRMGDYTEFAVDPGDHYVGVKCFGGWTPTWKKDALRFKAQPKGRLYFLISPDASCAKIERISEEKGKQMLQESEHIPVEQG